MLQCLDQKQTNAVCAGAGASRTFDIFSGVRQGCVLNPRLVCADINVRVSEIHVDKHRVEKPYVGNGAKIRYKFCTRLLGNASFGKRRGQCFFPSCWGVSMLKNAIEDTKQFHQKFLRTVVKKFCSRPTFVTSFDDLQTGARTLQLFKWPLCLYLCGRSVKELFFA